MNIAEAVSERPYSCRRIRSFWFWDSWGIYFEESRLREVSHMNKEDLVDMVFMLNTAYSLGVSMGYVYGQHSVAEILHTNQDTMPNHHS